jgi:DNA replication protein
MGAQSVYAKSCLYGDAVLPTKAVTYLRRFHSTQRKNLLLLGAPGTGKTYGAIAYVCWWGSSDTVGVVTAYRLSELLARRAYHELDVYREKSYLVVDDLGVSPEGFKAGDFSAWFQDMFSYRHSKGKVTIITSNGTKEVINQVLGERFGSRFNETGVVYTCGTEVDMRQTEGIQLDVRHSTTDY